MKSQNKPKRGLKKKRYIIPVTLILILIALRLYLPIIVKDNVNKVLAEIPGYYGQIEDIHISLIRGAYVINGMYLNKVNAKTQIPFLKFPKTDISIEWKSLLSGNIVSEIIMYNPEIIYVKEDQSIAAKEPDVNDWTKALTDLVPIDINHLTINNGKLAYVELNTDPNIDLQFNTLYLKADNLRNVKENERVLPSPITATAISIGGGEVKLNGNLNIIKEIPDMDVSFSLENADIKALNPFTRHYSGIDFEEGQFGLYSEIAIADGYFKGYMKPLLKNSKLIGKDDGVLGVIWEGFVGFFKFVLKNQSTDTIATKIPMEGDLNNIKSGILPTIGGIFKNAWISAFKGEIDDEIEYKDAFIDEDLSRK
ncbi:DUF748 domain-containing protein [Lacinutrix algicola]|uniref:DUF748 domain-containing protein n=1 Tax=Lacinutrix algicola TaxID=342954 RepID=UPI0006E1C2D2|nr:DUF748 domain-containing protein [Lacinutrix algicola]